MNDTESIRKTLVRLLEGTDGLTQSQLAERISFTPSRLSRLLSGETDLARQDAEVIARGIWREQATEFADYLKQEWRFSEAPAFDHVSRARLWKAEQAFQDLEVLKANPNLRSAFIQQIDSVREGLKRSGDQLRSIEHPVVLVGPPAVGKTTVACVASGLRRLDDREDDLDRQMALQTGGGRVTICEVHIRNGSEYSISVDPCSVEEVHQFVSEFCDDLLRKEDPSEEGTPEDFRIPSEVERAIRNMSELLPARKIKTDDGPVQRRDAARELALAFPNKADLLVQVLALMDLPRRTMTSVAFPRGTPASGLDWVAKLVGQINYGRHPDFSLPRRIEITVPTRILGTEDLDIRLVDTRGLDEPSAPRRDLQAFLDDERCLIVFCTNFGDAPNGATLAVMERAIRSGLRQSLINRGLLLVLPRGKEDRKQRDPSTGAWADTSEEGREIKADHIASTLLHQGCQKLQVLFANVAQEGDSSKFRAALVERIRQIRQRSEGKVDELVAASWELLANSKDEESQAVFEAATEPIRAWIAANGHLPGEVADVHTSLITGMGGLRYVSSLRASVNRYGSWDRFDYWLHLGTGARAAVVRRCEERVNDLKALINAALTNEAFPAVHNLLKHFLSGVESAVAGYYRWAQGLGETSFKSQLGDDAAYWSACKARWGQGKGYRDEVKAWTEKWFDEAAHQERREFIEAEIQKQWSAALGKLNEALSSGEGVKP